MRTRRSTKRRPLSVRPVPPQGGPVRGPDEGSRLLIVNADDYGLTSKTSETIVRLHDGGLVTSTSALVLAPAFAATAHLIAGHPTLGVGVHLSLVGPDPAVCESSEIPTLLNRRGQLARSWHFLLHRLLSGRVDLDDVRREFTAQVEVALAHGLEPTHVDSHQHLHLWPGISTVAVEVARTFGIPAMRCPESRSYKTERVPVSVMARNLRRQITAAGLATTDRFAGLDESGKAVADCFDRVLDQAPTTITSFEFGVHPGADGDAERQRYPWRNRCADEAVGLARPGLADALRAQGWRPGTFADLAQVPSRIPVLRPTLVASGLIVPSAVMAPAVAPLLTASTAPRTVGTVPPAASAGGR